MKCRICLVTSCLHRLIINKGTRPWPTPDIQPSLRSEARRLSIHEYYYYSWIQSAMTYQSDFRMVASWLKISAMLLNRGPFFFAKDWGLSEKYDLAYPDFPVRQSLVPLRHRRLRVGGKFCLDIHFVPGEGQTWGEVWPPPGTKWITKLFFRGPIWVSLNSWCDRNRRETCGSLSHGYQG